MSQLEMTDPRIVKAVADHLKKAAVVKSLVADRVLLEIPETLPAGPYLVCVADNATVPMTPKTLMQSVVGVVAVAEDEAMMGLLSVAVQKALSGKVFAPITAAVLMDTGRARATPLGWPSRKDLYGCFHSVSAIKPAQ